MPRLMLAAVVLAVAAPSGLAQDDQSQTSPLLVGVKPSPPFVMVDEPSGQVTGFSIDLIRMLAAQLDPSREVKFQVRHELAEHLDDVRDRRVDLGIAATSLSSKRERAMDFSLPFFRSGLDIVVRPEGGGVNYWDILTSRQILVPFLWLILFLVACAHVIWFTERGKQDTFDDDWLTGVGQAGWWTVVTMTTVGYGDFVPRKPLSRVLGVLIIMAGIILFGMVVGTFSSVLTVQKLATDIRGPEDLRGRSVAVVSDTIAVETMRKNNAKLIVVDSLGEALKAVEKGKAFAAVHDFPQLHHHLAHSPQHLILVNRPFAKQGYAIAFSIGSPLRKKINVALLELMEGEPSLYWQLYERWFSAPE